MPDDVVETITAAYLDARYGDQEDANKRLQEAVAAIS